MLYVAVGSMTEPTKVQDLSTLNGKLLRLNVAAFVPGNPSSLIPSDNPFVNTPGAVRRSMPMDFAARSAAI